LTWEVFSPGNFGERGTDGMDLIKFLGGTKRTFEQTLKKCVARIYSLRPVLTQNISRLQCMAFKVVVPYQYGKINTNYPKN
jgi:hypothetical protein